MIYIILTRWHEPQASRGYTWTPLQASLDPGLLRLMSSLLCHLTPQPVPSCRPAPYRLSHQLSLVPMLGEGRGEQSLDLSLVTYVYIHLSLESRRISWLWLVQTGQPYGVSRRPVTERYASRRPRTPAQTPFYRPRQSPRAAAFSAPGAAARWVWGESARLYGFIRVCLTAAPRKGPWGREGEYTRDLTWCFRQPCGGSGGRDRFHQLVTLRGTKARLSAICPRWK